MTAKQNGHDPRTQAGDPEEVYRGLRNQVLNLDPAEVGIERAPDGPAVWGAMIDMGMAGGTATIIGLADGTTSMYTSTGGGIIGGGFHRPVADATRTLLSCVEAHLGHLAPDDHPDLPASGRVVIRALTYHGPRSAEASEDDLGHRRHPLSPVFYAAHDVITQLRIIDERRAAAHSGE